MVNFNALFAFYEASTGYRTSDPETVFNHICDLGEEPLFAGGAAPDWEQILDVVCRAEQEGDCEGLVEALRPFVQNCCRVIH